MFTKNFKATHISIYSNETHLFKHDCDSREAYIIAFIQRE